MAAGLVAISELTTSSRPVRSDGTIQPPLIDFRRLFASPVQVTRNAIPVCSLAMIRVALPPWRRAGQAPGVRRSAEPARLRQAARRALVCSHHEVGPFLARHALAKAATAAPAHARVVSSPTPADPPGMTTGR